ncbi:MAG TPA: CoA pyrophosphatase, partial [Polyangiaceae bacterium]|nr:CoA pyrophosphatase [Polyangiaceae bacterium]
DLSDENLLVTAMRETQEEVGVNLLEAAEYLGQLPVVAVARHGRALQIHPFVFALKDSVEFRTNHEVDGVFWVALDSLLDGSRETTLVQESNGSRFRFPAWDVEGQPVWGLTYRMLRSLLAALEESTHE